MSFKLPYRGLGEFLLHFTVDRYIGRSKTEKKRLGAYAGIATLHSNENMGAQKYEAEHCCSLFLQLDLSLAKRVGCLCSSGNLGGLVTKTYMIEDTSLLLVADLGWVLYPPTSNA
jgi:hypothetical protein